MSLLRRAFLKGGAVITIMLALATWSYASIAEACSEPPSTTPVRVEFEYRGRHVVIEETDQTVAVTINTCPQPHITKNVPQQGPPFYTSSLLPFGNYSSALDLVRALIDGEDAGLFVLCSAYPIPYPI